MGKRSTSRIDGVNDPDAQDTYTVNDRMQADAQAAADQQNSGAPYEEDVVIIENDGDDDEYDDDDDDMVDEDTEDPDAIRDNIEQTRSDMGDTIDAIQAKLNPQRITQQVTESVRDATIGRAEEFMSDMSQRAQGLGASLGETLRENWVPAALIGVGVGWLLFRNGANRQQNRNDYYPRGYSYGRSDYPNYPNPADYQARTYSTSSGGQGGMQQSMRQGMRRMGQAVSQAQDNIGDAMGSVQDKMGDTMDAVQDKMGDAMDTMQDTMSNVGYQAQQAQSWLADAYDDNPLLFGALALATGAAVALAIPETQQENEWMGPTRDNMLQQAESAAQDTLQKTQQVAKRAASAATDAAQDEAKKQQLTH